MVLSVDHGVLGVGVVVAVLLVEEEVPGVGVVLWYQE